jgi:glycosyltransferase involved in cell wall biosynthesis
VTALVYVTNVRLPTEKANGLQVMRMCASFQRAGLDVELWHPRRKQYAPDLDVSPFDYYGIERGFTIKTLPNVDVERVRRHLPPNRFAMSLTVLHDTGWAYAAARRARRDRDPIYYTRQPVVAWFLARAGLTTVLEVHQIPVGVTRRYLEGVLRLPSLVLVVGLTRALCERLVGMGAPEERTVHAPDAVELDLFEGLAGRDECRRLHGLPLERPIVGYIGRFVTMQLEKGVPVLVEAVASLRDGPRPMLLAVGGPVEAAARYREQAGQLGLGEDDLRLVDRVPPSEVPSWIRACDVVTIPWEFTTFSAYYTSPMKLFEYMAAEVPIVASDLPALRDVLSDESALLVEPGSAASLAAGIEKTLADPEAAHARAAAARATVDEHTWDRRARGLCDAMAEALRG